MSDIQPGDVVVCVDAKPDFTDPLAHLLSEGRYYRVAAVGNRTPDGVLAVAFRSIPSSKPNHGWAYAIRRFRKIRPADEGFSAWMKTCRPKSRERTNA